MYSGFHRSEQQIKTIKQQAKEDKAKIKSLKKDLRYKEKTLAETAALLMLQKSSRPFTVKNQRTINASR